MQREIGFEIQRYDTAIITFYNYDGVEIEDEELYYDLLEEIEDFDGSDGVVTHNNKNYFYTVEDYESKEYYKGLNYIKE